MASIKGEGDRPRAAQAGACSFVQGNPGIRGIACASRTAAALCGASSTRSVVRSITDRVLVMDRGRVVEDGPTDRVLDAPQSDAAVRLAQAMPRMPGFP